MSVMDAQMKIEIIASHTCFEFGNASKINVPHLIEWFF